MCGCSTVCVWELATGQLLHSLSGHSHTVKALAWKPDKGRGVLASAGLDGVVGVWGIEHWGEDPAKPLYLHNSPRTYQIELLKSVKNIRYPLGGQTSGAPNDWNLYGLSPPILNPPRCVCGPSRPAAAFGH
jgi:WD40 repeat protein